MQKKNDVFIDVHVITNADLRKFAAFELSGHEKESKMGQCNSIHFPKLNHKTGKNEKR